ncbi:saccharopine dehydrogenase NADP-binding domain-containing protein [Gottfriedia solisilvae]|uniref:Saccharopine dehydrogenase NADP binding domain-containing protein n=1 Tax=Gottfriedia solisilvae TaxID=1516104 RepID=A0A8J3ACY2_9BACI|nr:saccharopine dehydrogenase NADP-binding domain-containing protein [Gottfriedia solisilvae]GGI11671.1 hypothetical protein GCM10007380_09010 [Gottfriedia solisilvae]
MSNNHTVITILGSSGGVAKSILAILNHSANDASDPVHNLIRHSKIHLIDVKQKENNYYNKLFSNLENQFIIHQFDLKDTERFKKHLKKTETKIVIDVSWADTIEMLHCCNELGVYYVNSALENTMIDENEELFEGFPLIERIRIFERNKHSFQNTKAIVCSGMNPGVVQWMALELIKKYPLEIPQACYIVEHDTSFYVNKDNTKDNVIYVTWSPECFLDEAILCYPMFMKHRSPLFIYEKVYDLEFKVTLGDKSFYGCLMPHEEVYTLCRLFDMEGGFLYRINEYTTELIKANLDHVDDLWEYEMKVLDPSEAPLEGDDMVGVLLVYDGKERYIYNSMNNCEIFEKFKTNATYFQVACGLYSALSTLLLDSIPNGVHYVDELLLNTKNNYGQYLSYYMSDFVIGENSQTDGLLLDRMKKLKNTRDDI